MFFFKIIIKILILLFILSELNIIIKKILMFCVSNNNHIVIYQGSFIVDEFFYNQQQLLMVVFFLKSKIQKNIFLQMFIYLFYQYLDIPFFSQRQCFVYFYQYMHCLAFFLMMFLASFWKIFLIVCLPIIFSVLFIGENNEFWSKLKN